MLLIDTCVLLWLAIDQDNLSEQARIQLGENTNKICISSISAFEMVLKRIKTLLKLPCDPKNGSQVP